MVCKTLSASYDPEIGVVARGFQNSGLSNAQEAGMSWFSKVSSLTQSKRNCLARQTAVFPGFLRDPEPKMPEIMPRKRPNMRFFQGFRGPDALINYIQTIGANSLHALSGRATQPFFFPVPPRHTLFHHHDTFDRRFARNRL
jgi:hypothetical protein